MGLEWKLILVLERLLIKVEKRSVGIEAVSNGENLHNFFEVFIRGN
jgi:hypothetical protein